MHRFADTHLPVARPKACHLRRNITHGGKHQRPGVFRRSERRRPAMHVRAQKHPVVGAGFDINMRVDASLRDQAQIRQTLNQFAGYGGALAEQRYGVEWGKPLSQRVNIGLVVRKDRHVNPVEFGETGKAAKRIEPVIQYGKPHQMPPSQTFAGTNNCPSASFRAVRDSPADLCRKPCASSS